LKKGEKAPLTATTRRERKRSSSEVGGAKGEGGGILTGKEKSRVAISLGGGKKNGIKATSKKGSIPIDQCERESVGKRKKANALTCSLGAEEEQTEVPESAIVQPSNFGSKGRG